MSDKTVTVFEAHAERYEQAYKAHAKGWALTNPRPKEPTSASLITWHHWVVAIILIASAIVSASHTLPVVLGEINKIGSSEITSPSGIDYILAIATFIMIEVTAIYFAYSHITNSNNGIDIPDITKPLKIGVFFTVGAMFAINIYGVLTPTGLIETNSIGWNVAGIAIYLWVACIPPVNAYLCGDVLAINVIELKLQNEVYYNDYLEDMEAWRNRLERSWSSKKSDYGVSIKVSNPSNNGMETVGMIPNSIPNKGLGMEKPRRSSKLETALEHYTNNPDDLQLDPTIVGQKISVGKSTMYKARSQIMDTIHD